jgi:hypothetical protein
LGFVSSPITSFSSPPAAAALLLPAPAAFAASRARLPLMLPAGWNLLGHAAAALLLGPAPSESSASAILAMAIRVAFLTGRRCGLLVAAA